MRGGGIHCQTQTRTQGIGGSRRKGGPARTKNYLFGHGGRKTQHGTRQYQFCFQEQDHDVFKRKGADLLITKPISLNEALCGVEWKIKHLDGRSVVIQSKPGEVIKPESDNGKPFLKIVRDEGMPSRGNPFVKGNLYVLFRVEFPKDGQLSTSAMETLKKVLPGACQPLEVDEEEDELVRLEHADLKNFGKGGVPSQDSFYDSDDEDQPGVQCQQS